MSDGAKKQHYVPRCLLKHFATEDRLSVYDAHRGIARHKRNIKKEFAENYYYGEEGSVETFLSNGVESPAAPILDLYASKSIVSDASPPRELLKFILVQLSRTPGSLSEALEVIDKFTGTIIRQFGELNGFPEDVVSKIKVVPANPKAIMMRLAVTGITRWPLISDLGQRLLVNETAVPFVISDHPIVHYNWYLKDSDDPARTSLVVKGLQIFLPISPVVTLCLYDKSVYKFEGRRSAITILKNEDDVRLLNRLQAMNREHMIIFPNKDYEEYVVQLCTENPAGSLHGSEAVYSAPRAAGNEKLASEHAVWRSQAKIDGWLSVVSIRTKARANRNVCAERNPEEVASYRRIMARFDEDLRAHSNHSLQARRP